MKKKVGTGGTGPDRSKGVSGGRGRIKGREGAGEREGVEDGN